jgi:hypothetical protein
MRKIILLIIEIGLVLLGIGYIATHGLAGTWQAIWHLSKQIEQWVSRQVKS